MAPPEHGQEDAALPQPAQAVVPQEPVQVFAQPVLSVHCQRPAQQFHHHRREPPAEQCLLVAAARLFPAEPEKVGQ